MLLITTNLPKGYMLSIKNESLETDQRKNEPIGLIFSWLGLGDGNITFSDELDFDPSELDIVYRGDSTEDER